MTRETIEAARLGDPFARHDLLIARLDHLARSDELVEQVRASEWDLMIVDEAHRMSAHWYGNEVSETRRYRLGKAFGDGSRSRPTASAAGDGLRPSCWRRVIGLSTRSSR